MLNQSDTGHAEMPWFVEETDLRLSLHHDHRWLRLIGFPAIAVGATVAVGIWLIPGIDIAEAWPMLMVGALIGIAFVLIGLQLSFSVVEFSAERGKREIVRTEGFGPFMRTRRFAIDANAVVKVSIQPDAGMVPGYLLEVKTATGGVRIARFPDLQPIEIEALRWAQFLNLPLETVTT